MCLTKKSFEFMDRRSSNKARQLKLKADLLLNQLHYNSTDTEVQKYLLSRKTYLEFLWQEPRLIDGNIYNE